MYILYLDDSGSASNANESHFVLGGFAVFERQIHWIARELDSLAAKLYPSQPDAVEFHASEMFSGREPPWNGMSKDDRREAIKGGTPNRCAVSQEHERLCLRCAQAVVSKL